MILCIAGPRDEHVSVDLLHSIVCRYFGDTPIEAIIHGDGSGIDQCAARWAAHVGYRCDAYPANWTLGKKAGPMRNQQMADIADALLAVHHGYPGPGTRDVVRQFVSRGKEVHVVKVGRE